jgi:hypothetical protein
MENIAFTTLVLILFAIPGYCVRAVYFTEDFSADVVSRSLTEEIYLAIVCSIPFHLSAVGAIDYLYTNYYWMSVNVDFEMVLGFLSGRLGREGGGIAKEADNLYYNFGIIILYFSGLTLIAMGVGFGLRAVVWRFKLDVRIPTFFRFQNKWLYTFTGRDRKSKERLFAVVDAMCLLSKEKTRLYRGVVLGFDSNAAGDLEQIRLGLAYRGKFKETKKGVFSFPSG